VIDPRTLVVMPTYNEAETLKDVVARLLASAPGVDVLVVDDASPDGTGEIADDLAVGDARLHVMHRKGKSGLGTAYVAGFRWALDEGYDLVVEMDADGSHLPEQLPRLLGATAHADLVIGTRWMPRGGTENWPLRRQILSRGASAYTRIMLGVGQRDATAGFRVYRADVLRAINLSGVASQGYAFQIETLWRAVQAGFRVVEVPITFVEREFGESKMSGAIVREAIVNVGRWGVLRRSQQLTAQAERLVARLRRR
jgi:dolichol-phosphate mannosyltransferase